jgi:hypothetical protein
LAVLTRAAGQRHYDYKLPLPERLYPPTGIMELPLPVGTKLTNAKLLRGERGSHPGALRVGHLVVRAEFPALNVPTVMPVRFAVLGNHNGTALQNPTWIGQFQWTGSTYLCFAFAA